MGERKMMIEQEGVNCIVTIYGETRQVKNCNALKLANTMWDKESEKYTNAEMEEFGFELNYFRQALNTLKHHGDEEDFYNDFHQTGGGGERQ